jgi:hypothetical protein
MSALECDAEDTKKFYDIIHRLCTRLELDVSVLFSGPSNKMRFIFEDKVIDKTKLDKMRESLRAHQMNPVNICSGIFLLLDYLPKWMEPYLTPSQKQAIQNARDTLPSFKELEHDPDLTQKESLDVRTPFARCISVFLCTPYVFNVPPRRRR